MYKVMIFALLLTMTACVDHGKCLRSEVVHHEGFVYTTYVYTGSSAVPVIQYMPATDSTECTLWEFPNGKPKS